MTSARIFFGIWVFLTIIWIAVYVLYARETDSTIKDVFGALSVVGLAPFTVYGIWAVHRDAGVDKTPMKRFLNYNPSIKFPRRPTD